MVEVNFFNKLIQTRDNLRQYDRPIGHYGKAWCNLAVGLATVEVALHQPALTLYMAMLAEAFLLNSAIQYTLYQWNEIKKYLS